MEGSFVHTDYSCCEPVAARCSFLVLGLHRAEVHKEPTKARGVLRGENLLRDVQRWFNVGGSSIPNQSFLVEVILILE